MILPDFVLPSRVNQHWEYTGIDHRDHCMDRRHFDSYVDKIDYVYNSRGFRDSEWPDDLTQVVWCLGDSFTVGLGSPITHTWPYLLAKTLNTRTINVSMDGASNSWLARKAVRILQTTSPTTVVIHWSYIERREDPDDSMTDEQRRLSHLPGELGIIKGLTDFQRCVRLVEQHKGNSRVIHSAIPHATAAAKYSEVQQCWSGIAGPDWPPQAPMDVNDIPEFVVNELKAHNTWEFISKYYQVQELLHTTLDNVCYVGATTQLDFARDGHHYDIKTATALVQSICQALGR
jgi:hypothetical protein